MNLAAVAYLLFQRVMRHDPTDTHWPRGPVPAVLLSHHLTPYLQLGQGGFGLELEDVKALRSWAPGPRHPEYSNIKRMESTAGPPGKGLANVVGVAMASRGEGGVLAARTLLPYPLTEEAA